MNNNIIAITEESSTVVTVPVNAVQVDLKTETGLTVYVPLATRTSPGIVKIGDGLLIDPITGLLSLDTDEITLLGVKVNGTALIPDEDKYVDVIVPTKTSDLINDGDGESPYATEDYVWHYGGAVNGLILNDVTQPIDENKMIIVNIDKTTVGLGNVDNTSDADKPISTAVNNALSVMQNDIDSKLSKDSADVALMDNLTTSVLNDNVTLTKSFINLKTQVTSTDSFSLPLATDQTGGLMSSADYSQIRNNTSRIEQLEGQTKRLLYTDKTNPTAQEINDFVTDLGYTSPFSGIAVVVDQTFHIWHYYTNTTSWKDDGPDTVSQFTNSSPGVILGSATDGKVYAETNGTGSVYGWDTLTNRVSDLETNMPTNTSDLINDGDGASPFATEDYVLLNGGKIDSISVNNVSQTIDANKNVNITVPTNADYVDLSTVQTITGQKTFSSNIKLNPGVGIVDSDGNSILSVSSGNLNLHRTTIPDITNTRDLGSSSKKWQDLYLSRNLTDGTNSVSVADIASTSYVYANYVSVNAQTLTDAQKAQARQNIGAGSASATSVLVNSVVQSTLSFDSDPQTQITTNTNNISDILALIPAQASASDQLAPKSFVNSTVQTATANFRGNWATWSAVPTDANNYPVDYAGNKTPTVNDYLVVQDASGYIGTALTGTWRFKYSGEWATDGKNGWLPEYQVNETPLTAGQLAALNSGITTSSVQQIYTNTNNIQTHTNAINTLTSDKMDKASPVGTGSLSINRKENTTTAPYSVAVGYNNTASAVYSVGIGGSNNATGQNSLALGSGNTTSARFSTAIGNGNTSSNTNSMALGYGNTASGDSSATLNAANTASGWASFAHGNASIASGDYSYAGGHGVTASSASQHVFGKYNTVDSNSTYAEIVGNGTADNARSNARTLDWSGNEVLAGGLKINGTDDVITADDVVSTTNVTPLANYYTKSETDSGFAGVDASNLSNANVNSWASTCKFERSEVIYNMNSADSSINWGYTSGIFADTTVTGKDFSKYKYLIVWGAYGNQDVGCALLNLQQTRAYDGVFAGRNVYLYANEGSLNYVYTVGADVNNAKTSISSRCYLTNIANGSNVGAATKHITAIEGVY